MVDRKSEEKIRNVKPPIPERDKYITVVIVMKNGRELNVKCESFEVETDRVYGTLTGYNIKGIKENYPLYLNINDIQYIYRV